MKNWPPTTNNIESGEGVESGVGESGEGSNEGDGDVDSSKFLWEDTWEMKNANRPIMKSNWENDKVLTQLTCSLLLTSLLYLTLLSYLSYFLLLTTNTL